MSPFQQCPTELLWWCHYFQMLYRNLQTPTETTMVSAFLFAQSKERNLSKSIPATDGVAAKCLWMPGVSTSFEVRPGLKLKADSKSHLSEHKNVEEWWGMVNISLPSWLAKGYVDMSFRFIGWWKKGSPHCDMSTLTHCWPSCRSKFQKIWWMTLDSYRFFFPLHSLKSSMKLNLTNELCLEIPWVSKLWKNIRHQIRSISRSSRNFRHGVWNSLMYAVCKYPHLHHHLLLPMIH